MSQILYSDPKADGSVDYWRVETLWAYAAGLPSRKILLAELRGMDEVLWFGGPKNIRPTCRAVVEHARRIRDADLRYPIILSAGGDVWDGMHRVARAHLEGLGQIDAVQFVRDPPPDGNTDAPAD